MECSKLISEALLLCNEGKDMEAKAKLLDLGYKYRLTEPILRYPILLSRNNTATDASLDGEPTSAGFCAVYDNVLTEQELEILRATFDSGKLFWSFHQYTEGVPSEYFSYAFDLNEPNSGAVIQTIASRLQTQLADDFPAIKEANFIEWWAHCRPHFSGHQLHFDSDDEGRNDVRNPIVSVVLYIRGEVGGPTLVTDQKMGDRRLAQNGWLCFPRENRLCVFDGSLLHMVVPGRRDQECLSMLEKQHNLETTKRVTLMVSFWRDLKIRNQHGRGSAVKFPDEKADIEWTRRLRTKVTDISTHVPEKASVVEVENVWSSLRNDDTVTMPSYDECFQGF